MFVDDGVTLQPVSEILLLAKRGKPRVVDGLGRIGLHLTVDTDRLADSGLEDNSAIRRKKRTEEEMIRIKTEKRERDGSSYLVQL